MYVLFIYLLHNGVRLTLHCTQRNRREFDQRSGNPPTHTVREKNKCASCFSDQRDQFFTEIRPTM